MDVAIVAVVEFSSNVMVHGEARERK